MTAATCAACLQGDCDNCEGGDCGCPEGGDEPMGTAAGLPNYSDG